jgi:hypothetical protein
MRQTVKKLLKKKKKKLLLVYHYDGKRVGKYNISIHKHRHVTKRIKLSKLYAAKKRTLSRVFFFFFFNYRDIKFSRRGGAIMACM